MVYRSSEPGELQVGPVQHLAVPSAQAITRTIREVYGQSEGQIVLHAPVFCGREREYVLDTIESTYVSSVGGFVDRIEVMLREATGARHAIATVNGTTALQLALIVAGVEHGDIVVTQSLSFAATTNAIVHAGATPAFVDIDRVTLGMSPTALRDFLAGACERSGKGCRLKSGGARVAACVPMHTFGIPCDIDEIAAICRDWGIALVEDAAEALGSYHDGRHCGTTGLLGTLSFNGNKVVTTGGGGAILTNDDAIARRTKHLSTTAKSPHRWRFYHDEVGYNFRMPNLNAALGCAQLEQLDTFIAFKRDLARRYAERFAQTGVPFVSEPEGTSANYWLCAILMPDRAHRDDLLGVSNDAGVMTRPVWEPLHTLPMYRKAPCGPLPVTLDIADRLVNIPSGFRQT